MKTFKQILSGVLSSALILSSVATTMPVSTTLAAGENYAEALELALYFYDGNECGCEVDDNALTWRGNCHTYDATASLDKAEGLGNLKSKIQELAGGNTIDVSGGYHDAGDHVKFNLTMGFNASTLGWAYYDSPNAFKDTNSEAHLFDILRNTADYFMKTTYLDSNNEVVAFCYNVSDETDHRYWESPEVQTYERKTYWATPSNNNQSVCFEMVAALAATASALKESDSAYAAECMKYADALYKFGTKNSGNELAGMAGMYNTTTSIDEQAWAEAWLYANDKSKYSKPSYTPNNGAYNNTHYDYWLHTWDKVWGGYSGLMYSVTGDNTFAKELKFEFDNQVKNPSAAYYCITDWGTTRYNCTLQKYALTYGDSANDSTYKNYAKNQMSYILGNNPTGYSFLVGYGDKYPSHIHHRAANPGAGDSKANPAAKYTLYGALIGGPKDANGTYSDHTDDYACSEMALDYNACFILAASALYDEFGGDTTTASKIIANASEIKDNFSFGGSDIVVPTNDVSATIKVYDVDTNETVDGVEVIMDIVNDTTQYMEHSRWTTSNENNPQTIEGLSYDTTFRVSLGNLPEGYSLAVNQNSWTFNYSPSTDVVPHAVIDIPLVKSPQISNITANVKAYDYETNELVSGVGLSVTSDMISHVEYWNTSNENPKSVTVPSDLEYYVIVDTIPDGYTMAVDTRMFSINYPSGSTGDVTVNIDIPLMKTPITSTEPTEPTEPTTGIRGDANCDGSVTIADVVAAASVAAVPESFSLSAQGLINADLHNTGDGISSSDASIIQELAIGLTQADY